MPKQTIRGQQELIDDLNKIIHNLIKYYKGRKIPDFEKAYIKCLEKSIAERKAWIAEQNMCERS